jgi:hypothetical protein
MVCEASSPHRELLTNITTLLHSTSTSTSSSSSSSLLHSSSFRGLGHEQEKDQGGMYTAMKEYLESQLRPQRFPLHYQPQQVGAEGSVVSVSLSLSFSSSISALLHLFRQVCSLAPSLVHHLPEWLRLGCLQLSVLLLSSSPPSSHYHTTYTSELDTLKLLAASVLSQAVRGTTSSDTRINICLVRPLLYIHTCAWLVIAV